VLITLSLAGHFHSVTPRWSDTVVWSSAIITGLLFFAALLSHEMAHSLVAKAYGLKVRSITLFALGGVSQIESEASDAKLSSGLRSPVLWPVSLLALLFY
jgi:Zn-dependent protease